MALDVLVHRRMKSLAWLPILAACSQSPRGISGPFTGEATRYVVDRFDLPTNSALAREYGDDLDGNGIVDNALGMVIGTLVNGADLNTNGSDMRASGALVSSIVIQADDLANDPTVGVTYYGLDGDPATVMGGAFVDGRFDANLIRDTTLPGAARVRLPVFADADPITLDLPAMELTLLPDGAGGYEALVRGVVQPSQARLQADTGLLQMVTDDPIDHLEMERFLDTNHDGVISEQELTTSKLLGSLLEPDVEMFDDDGELSPNERDTAPDALSLGFAIHLIPCAQGSCAPPPVDTCHDRVLDGDETAVDCGGSCGPCPSLAACIVADDCSSHACNDNTCAPSSCSDGVADGVESDVDCGGGCGPCAAGKSCVIGADCASGYCDGVCSGTVST